MKSHIASIAQLGERQTEDLKVTGSIPVGGSFFVINLVEQVFLSTDRSSLPKKLTISS